MNIYIYSYVCLKFHCFISRSLFAANSKHNTHTQNVNGREIGFNYGVRQTNIYTHAHIDFTILFHQA